MLHRPLQDVLDSGARVVATQMARTAQPFGTGADAREAGERATSRDISKVYATPGKAYEDISNPRYKGAFWSAYKKGDISKAQDILDANGSKLRGVQMTRFDGGTAHKGARNTTTGRVNQNRPSMIVIDPKALDRYVKEELKHVGTGKGGFADIVRAIGGSPRGLREEGDITANWITRNGHGYGKAFHSGSPDHPIVTIRNSIPYASHILAGGALNEAIRIGHERMISNLRIAIKSETAHLRSTA